MTPAHAPPKYMTNGELGLVAALVALAFLSIVVAAKAYTPEYAFHAYLFAAASAAAVFAIFNRFFDRSDEPMPLEIDGKPNYNMGPVKLATMLAVFWGIAGIDRRPVDRARARISGVQFRSVLYFVRPACARCTPPP